MKKIIYSYISNNETRLIVDNLKKKAEWEPVFFHGNSNIKKWVEKKYPQAVLADSTKLRQGFFDYSKLGKRRPIDAEIIKNLSIYQQNYMSWLQDTSGWNFSYFERRRYYYDMLTYWNTVVNNFKPDIFISYTWPHLPSDFALYLLCKHHYKIPVVFNDITPFFNKYYYNTACSLEDLSLPFKNYYNSKKNFNKSKIVDEYLKKLRSTNPSSPRHIIKFYDKLKKNNSMLKRFIKLAYLLITGRAFRISESTFKSNKKPWGHKKSLLTNFGEFLFLIKMVFKSKFLKRKYSKLVKKVNSGDKYIYFAAPFQPEAISNISCGPYEDPLLILDMLSSIIPDDWKIYYKEHPATFNDIFKGTLYKDKYYYENISKFSNINFISTEEDTFDLIDNSEAVATVGGTVGWEAIVRGKPALLFGNLWYGECKSVFLIKTYEDLENAILKILNGYAPSKKDVDRYAESLFQASKKIITLNNYNSVINNSNMKNEMTKVSNFLLSSVLKFYPNDEA